MELNFKHHLKPSHALNLISKINALPVINRRQRLGLIRQKNKTDILKVRRLPSSVRLKSVH